MTDLSTDSRVVALLCAPLKPPKGEDFQSAGPLSPKKWFDLDTRIRQSDFQYPGDLLDADVPSLMQALNLSEPEALRLRQRLDLGDELDQELAWLSDREMWLLTIADPDYPTRLSENIPTQAPPVLFGSGNTRSLQDGGLAVVGPRHASQSDLEYAAAVGEQCAAEGIAVISGGARGVDQYAMNGAIANGGNAIGVLGDSLEKLAATPDVSCQIQSGNLMLISPYHPKAHFQVGQAMGRNKIVYALADWALVVACQVGQGGTWNGAIAALRNINVPILVRADDQISDGNRELIKRGALEFAPQPWTDLTDSLTTLTAAYQLKHNTIPNQPGLFDNPTS